MKRTKLIFMPLKNLVQGISKGFMMLSLVALLFAFGVNSASAQHYVSGQEATTILSHELQTTQHNLLTKVIYGETAVAKAELKISVIKTILLRIKEGNTVATAVAMVLGDNTGGATKTLDAHEQYKSNPKTGPSNAWLRQEIVELLAI